MSVAVEDLAMQKSNQIKALILDGDIQEWSCVPLIKPTRASTTNKPTGSSHPGGAVLRWVIDANVGASQSGESLQWAVLFYGLQLWVESRLTCQESL